MSDFFKGDRKYRRKEEKGIRIKGDSPNVLQIIPRKYRNLIILGFIWMFSVIPLLGVLRISHCYTVKGVEIT
jgi:hypothetical protein